MRMIVTPLALSAALVATAAFAAEKHGHDHDEKRELGSHEHGHVTVQIALEGDSLQMALEAPGNDIVGFEHAAETDEQKAAVSEATEALSDPLAVFTLPEAAGCSVASSDVELHREGDHNAFEAEYALTCTDVSALTVIETRLFEMFPSIREIEVEYATPAGQGAIEFESGETAIALPATS